MSQPVRIAGGALVVIAVALLLAPALVPPFLDRVYYRGPVSSHFDGRHFFNPEDQRPIAERRGEHGFSVNRMLRFARGVDRTPWPGTVSVRPTMPPRQVAGGAMRATWIGHSTVLVQADGLNILTDPIWSDRAGPFNLVGPTRVRAPGVRFEDLPHIDLVLVSHNHYDHMDLPTLKRLWARDRPLVVTSLGNDTILKGAGIPAQARDWGGRVPVRPGVEVIVERVHHWGSRWGSDRNRALWSGFTVTLPGGNLFFAGDTGWGDGGWVREAAAHGPFRLALVPIGAFNPRAIMAPSHIDPDQAVDVFRGLGAAHGLAVHWGTFQLSNEGFSEPPERLAGALGRAGIAVDRFRASEPGQGWDVP